MECVEQVFTITDVLQVLLPAHLVDNFQVASVLPLFPVLFASFHFSIASSCQTLQPASSMSADAKEPERLPVPDLPEPAHATLDSMLSRKFGKEVANYFSGLLSVGKLTCFACANRAQAPPLTGSLSYATTIHS